MPEPYTEELVTVRTADGLDLPGAVLRPAGGAGDRPAAVWVHGLGGAFYKPTAVEVGRALAARGYAFVTGGNRGSELGTRLSRDGGAFGGGAYALGGSLWERLEEAPLDLAAWVGLAAGLGRGGVVLVGHSAGGPKVVYYQAQRQDPRVAGLVLVDSNSLDRPPPTTPERDALARELVGAGRGEELPPQDEPDPLLTRRLSAQAYLSRQRAGAEIVGVPGDPARPPALARIRCPLLACAATEPPHPGGPPADRLERIRRGATAAARVDTRLLEGANHGLVGHEAAVAAVLAEWLDSLLPDARTGAHESR